MTIAQEINARLSPGVNIDKSTSTSGGVQTVIDEGYIQEAASAGFNSVRLPMYWQNYASETAPYTINQAYFDRADLAIQTALDAGLIVIIDLHSYSEMTSNWENELERFLSLWEQIADHYKDWSQDLIFEILNEPASSIGVDEWNQIYPLVLEKIRVKNPFRVVFLGVAYYNKFDRLNGLIPPNDNSVIVTIHYYEPFYITHQGASWVNNSDDWIGDTWAATDENQARYGAQLDVISTWKSQNNDFPVNIGEFGTYGLYADIESRRAWTEFNRVQYERRGFSWHYWEFYEGYGIWNPSTDTYQAELVSALFSEREAKNVKVETNNKNYTKIPGSEGAKVVRVRAIDGTHLIIISDVIPGNAEPAAMVLQPSNIAKWVQVPVGSSVYALLNSTQQPDGAIQFTVCDEDNE